MWTQLAHSKREDSDLQIFALTGIAQCITRYTDWYIDTATQIFYLTKYVSGPYRINHRCGFSQFKKAQLKTICVEMDIIFNWKSYTSEKHSFMDIWKQFIEKLTGRNCEISTPLSLFLVPTYKYFFIKNGL